MGNRIYFELGKFEVYAICSKREQCKIDISKFNIFIRRREVYKTSYK